MSFGKLPCQHEVHAVNVLTLDHSRYDAKMESSVTILISGHYGFRGSFGMERVSWETLTGVGSCTMLDFTSAR